MMAAARALIGDDSGATMVEYAIMAVLIAAVSIGAVQTLGQKTQSLFNSLVALL